MSITAGDFNTAVGAQMRAEIAAHNQSVKSAAEAMDIQRRVLIRYLDGERNIPISVVVRLAHVLGMPVHLIVQRAEARGHDQHQSLPPPATPEGAATATGTEPSPSLWHDTAANPGPSRAPRQSDRV